MHHDIAAYNNQQAPDDQATCQLLAQEISRCLPDAESKIWHAHPVWFLDGNPVVGYNKLKDGVRLLFWSGQTFGEAALQNEGSFKAAGTRYRCASEVNLADLHRWLEHCRQIQWDYKNIVKRKGVLERLK